MEKRNINKKTYFIRTYADETQIKQVLEYQDYTWWRAIIHDKDTDDTGNIKEKHAHIVIEFKERKKLTTVENIFKDLTDNNGKKINTHIEYTLSKTAAVNYLTHNTAKSKHEGKHIYSTEEIFGEGEFNIEEEQSIWLQILQDMKLHMEPYAMVKKYGFAYIQNIDKLEKINRYQYQYENRTLNMYINEDGEIVEGVQTFTSIEPDTAILLRASGANERKKGHS